MTTDLATWLLEQIDEDERIAEACGPEIEDRSWYFTEPFGETVRSESNSYVACGPYDGGIDGDFARHIARHDPIRVLAECKAKRRIVQLHSPMTISPGSQYFNDAHLTKEPMTICRSCEPETMFRRARSWPCRTLRAMTPPYADNPGYREEWAPE